MSHRDVLTAGEQESSKGMTTEAAEEALVIGGK